jgi:hypothetical protein
MQDIPVVLEDGSENPAFEASPALVTPEATAHELLQELTSLLKLPGYDRHSRRPLYYALRRLKSERVLLQAQSLANGGVLAGDSLVVEPVVSLSELIKELEESSFSSSDFLADYLLALHSRLRGVHYLMPVLAKAAETLERDLEENYFYEFLNPETILIKRTSKQTNVFLIDRLLVDDPEEFQLLNVRELLAAEKYRLLYISPQQRTIGFVRDKQQAAENYVFSLGAIVVACLLGQEKTPLIHLNSQPEAVDQILQQAADGLGPLLSQVLLKAMHPAPFKRYKLPSEFINEFNSTLDEWLEQFGWALSVGQPGGQEAEKAEKGLASLLKIRKEYRAGWRLERLIQTLEHIVKLQQLYREADKMQQADQVEKELEILEKIYRLNHDQEVYNRITDCRIRLNFKEAVRLQRSGRLADLEKALALYKSLPRDYEDVSPRLRKLQEKISSKR